MSSRKSKVKVTTKKKQNRVTSNIFSMFQQTQVKEFKEAFNVIDQNHNGFIDKEDLLEMFTSLGKEPSDEYLDDMLNQAQGQVNFTMFLTLFGNKLNGTDPENVIKSAFEMFDDNLEGFVNEESFREELTSGEDRMTHEEVDLLLADAPIEDGKIDYAKFTQILKHGKINNETEVDPKNM